MTANTCKRFYENVTTQKRVMPIKPDNYTKCWT